MGESRADKISATTDVAKYETPFWSIWVILMYPFLSNALLCFLRITVSTGYAVLLHLVYVFKPEHEIIDSLSPIKVHIRIISENVFYETMLSDPLNSSLECCNCAQYCRQPSDSNHRTQITKAWLNRRPSSSRSLTLAIPAPAAANGPSRISSIPAVPGETGFTSLVPRNVS